MQNQEATTIHATNPPAPLPEGWHLLLRAIVGGGPATPADTGEIPVSEARARVQTISGRRSAMFAIARAGLLAFYGSGDGATVAVSPRGARLLLEHETAAARAAMLTPTGAPAPDKGPRWIMLAATFPDELRKQIDYLTAEGWREHNITPGRAGDLYVMHMSKS